MKKISVIAFVLACTLLLAACGGAASSDEPQNGVVSVDMEAVYSRITEQVDMPEMAAVPENRRDIILGIAAEDCLQVVTVLCGDSVRADEIWLVEAVDETAADRIEDLAKVRLEQRAQEMENYLPEQFAVVEKAKLLREGCCVALFISPDSEAMEQIFINAFEG